MAPERPDRAGPPEFRIDVGRTADSVQLRVTGELDLAVAPRLRAAVIAHATEGGTLEIDLSDLEFLDSSGLQVLLYARKAAIADGWTLRIVRPTASTARQAMTIAGAEFLLPLVEDS